MQQNCVIYQEDHVKRFTYSDPSSLINTLPRMGTYENRNALHPIWMHLQTLWTLIVS